MIFTWEEFQNEENFKESSWLPLETSVASTPLMPSSRDSTMEAALSSSGKFCLGISGEPAQTTKSGEVKEKPNIVRPAIATKNQNPNPNFFFSNQLKWKFWNLKLPLPVSPIIRSLNRWGLIISMLWCNPLVPKKSRFR